MKALTSRTACHRDLRDIIAQLNPVLRGWGTTFEPVMPPTNSSRSMTI